ncbi:unnamed protein product [Allacma fusca]|uniref:Phospholipid scramblase n=1 Tax=Allacma fusca TaxID=39272 RepID=A0A8J2LR09_9HEXA|nr:unnamed protein product [Allacma fusca]
MDPERGDVKSEDVKLSVSSQNYGSHRLPESRALVSNLGYLFLKLKRKKTEDATDICEIERNGFLVAVTACKFSSEFGNNCFRGSDRRFARHFQYSIVEPFGEEILTVNGHQMACCDSRAEAEFTKGKEVLGRIVFTGNDGSYEIRDKNNETIYQIRNDVSKLSLLCCPCKCLHSFQFRILLPDGTPVGELGDRWDVNIPYLAGQSRFGISFPDELPEDTQWILLASSLLLRWQFWRPFSNGIWCLIYLLILVLVILVGLAVSLNLIIIK